MITTGNRITLTIALLMALLIMQQGCNTASETMQDPAAGLNGSFEVAKSGLPVNWIIYTPRTVPHANFDMLLDTTEFKDGKQSLKFVVRKCVSLGGRYSPGFCQEYQDTKPGETYKVSFWAKNAGSEFSFTVRGVKTKGGVPGVTIKSKEAIDAWRQFETTYTIPADMWLRIEVSVLQPGTFWIDDIKIEKVEGKVK